MPCKFPGNYFSVDTHSNKIDGTGISSNGNGIFSVPNAGSLPEPTYTGLVIPSLQAWWDASQSSTLSSTGALVSSGNINGWSSRVGNWPLTQSSGQYQPVYYADSGNNNNGTLYFQGVKDSNSDGIWDTEDVRYLTLRDRPGLIDASQGTIFIVFKPDFSLSNQGEVNEGKLINVGLTDEFLAGGFAGWNVGINKKLNSLGQTFDDKASISTAINWTDPGTAGYNNPGIINDNYSLQDSNDWNQSSGWNILELNWSGNGVLGQHGLWDAKFNGIPQSPNYTSSVFPAWFSNFYYRKFPKQASSTDINIGGTNSIAHGISNGFNGYISEILCFNDSLTEYDLAKTRDYLSHKHKIKIAQSLSGQATTSSTWSAGLDPWIELANACRANSGVVNFTYSFIKSGTPAEYIYSTTTDEVSDPKMGVTFDQFTGEIALAYNDWKETFEDIFTGVTVNFINLGLEQTNNYHSEPNFGDYDLPYDSRYGVDNIGDFRIGRFGLDQAGGVLGLGYYPGCGNGCSSTLKRMPIGISGNNGGDLIFDSNDYFRLDASAPGPDSVTGGFSIRYVAAHEIGHNLGIGHDQNPYSLMFASATTNYSMHSRFPNGLKESVPDRSAIYGIYGPSNSPYMDIASWPVAYQPTPASTDLAPSDEHFAFELQDYYEEDFRHFTLNMHTDTDGAFKGNLTYVSNDFYVKDLGIPRVWKNYLGQYIPYRNSITTLSNNSASSLVFTCWSWLPQIHREKTVTIEADLRFKYGSYDPNVPRELFYINFVENTKSYPGINEHASRAGANLTRRTDGSYGFNITYEPNGESNIGTVPSSSIHAGGGYSNWLRVRVSIIKDPNPPTGPLDCKESFTTTAGIYSLGADGTSPETELITGKLDHTCDFNIWNKEAFMQIFTYGQTNGSIAGEFTIDKIKLSPLK